MNKLTNEELKNNYPHYLTVGVLKKILNESNVSDDSKILVERIEDVYFEKHGWKSFLKEGEFSIKREDGTFLEDSMEQYHPAWYCSERDGKLFIKMHY